MAKSKKKVSPKKKSSAKKGNSSGSNKIGLVLISILVIGLVFYGLNETSSFTKLLSERSKQERSSETPNTSPIIEKQKTTPIQTETKPVESIQTEAKKPTQSTATKADEIQKESTETNSDLPIYSEDDNYYYSSSFDFTWPAYSQNDAIIEHAYYTLRYNEKTEQADWVAYKLSKKNLAEAKYKRKDNFKSDPDVKTKSASLSDYKGSGYDRGHLAPAADFSWTEQGLDESFFMSNMSPQDPSFNRGVWKKLEEQVRKWAVTNDNLYIVTGPIFKKRSSNIGKNKVGIPDQYFKVILELTGKEVKGIGFILDNEKSSKGLESFVVSIDKVEKITGLDFFPSIPDKLEDQIEKKYSYSLWMK